MKIWSKLPRRLAGGASRLPSITSSVWSFSKAFWRASSASSSFNSRPVTSRPLTRARRQSDAAPVPQPSSSSLSPGRAGTAAASSTGSMASRYPWVGCSSPTRPPRRQHSEVSAQDGPGGTASGEEASASSFSIMVERLPRFLHEPAGAKEVGFIHHQAPPDCQGRTFQYRCVVVEDDMRNGCVAEQRLQPGESDKVVRTQKFTHANPFRLTEAPAILLCQHASLRHGSL